MDIAEQILGPVGESETDGYETIASELASAIESKDHKQMVKAMKAFHAMVQAEPEEPLGDE